MWMPSQASRRLNGVYVEVGRLIRDTRKSKKMTQGRLAAAVGLSRTSVTNIERGRQKIFLHTLSEMADALGVRVHDLVPEQDKPTLEKQLPKDTPPRVRELISKMVGRTGDSR
jgi:transcriptional regulator with XRE-family HTH domain